MSGHSTFTVANGKLFTDPLQSSIKARYVNGDGVKVGDLVSENITLQTGGCPPTVCTPQIFVPEPATLALLGHRPARTRLCRNRAAQNIEYQGER